MQPPSSRPTAGAYSRWPSHQGPVCCWRPKHGTASLQTRDWQPLSPGGSPGRAVTRDRRRDTGGPAPLLNVLVRARTPSTEDKDTT